jgi:hypothetical protein
MKETPTKSLSFERIILISVLCGLTLLIVVSYAFTRPFTDFGVYYTAAHVVAHHNNPYSLPEVFAEQKALGFHQPIPVMFLCPPWVLTLIAPLGYVQAYVIAWLSWFGLLVVATAIASRLLMDIYFGSLDIPEISYPRSYRFFFGFTFYPVLMALKFAQFSPLILLGIVGCLHFQRKRQSIYAGLLFSLTLLKPHLVLLIWLALLLEREWKILVTSVVAAGALSVATISQYGTAFRDYWELMRGPYPALTVSGMLAGIRGVFENPDNYWLQYIPPLLGIIWLTFYWIRNRRNWVLTDRLPVLMVASVMAAPYGYTHDQILLMIPIVYLASRTAKAEKKIPLNVVAVYTLLNVSVLVVLIVAVRWAIVIAPVSLAVILLVGSNANLSSPQKIHMLMPRP